MLFRRICFLVILFSILTSTHTRAKTAAPITPDHLVILVFDQMRPDYPDRYNLKNFKRLRRWGINYKDAYVGHLSSETVVSHFVIPSGLLPREMPWQQDISKDDQNILSNGPGRFYRMGHLSQEQLFTVMNHLSKEIQQAFIPAKIKAKYPQGKVFAVGQKHYAAVTFGTSAADSIITIQKEKGLCKPSGVHVPEYILSNDRFTLECKNHYGTEESAYPWDGSRTVPGEDPNKKGGDRWVIDVATQIMDHESSWRALLLTMAGIDKAGHLTGDVDTVLPKAFTPKYSMQDILHYADESLGVLLDRLEKDHLKERTLIVLTADHGGQTDLAYLGNRMESHGGEDLVNEKSSPQPFFIDRLLQTGRVLETAQDTMVRVWLKKATSDPAGDKKVAALMSEISGMMEIYQLSPLPHQGAQESQKFRYTRIFQNFSPYSSASKKWALLHNQELADSMAAPNAPDLIGMLADGYGFDMPGDHGGAQEHVQRIPFYVAAPGIKPSVSTEKKRLVDLQKVVTNIMKL